PRALGSEKQRRSVLAEVPALAPLVVFRVPRFQLGVGLLPLGVQRGVCRLIFLGGAVIERDLSLVLRTIDLGILDRQHHQRPNHSAASSSVLISPCIGTTPSRAKSAASL